MSELESTVYTVEREFLSNISVEELLRRIAPAQIVLESGWESGTDYCGIPIVNPYYTGQIDWKTERD